MMPLLLGIALAAGFLLGARLGTPPAGAMGFLGFHRAGAGEKLEQVLELIDHSYVDTVNEQRLVDEVLEDMLARLDPHSYYIPAADLQAATEPLEGSFMGIGVEFSIQRDTIVVVSPVAGGPSEKLGIQAGDRFLKADTLPLAGVGITNDRVMKALRGPAGSKVTVKVLRGRRVPFDVTIERGEIPINSVAATLLDKDGTGYIKLSRFARYTEEEFTKAAEDLRDSGMRRLVLDLRGNGGGYLNAAIGICRSLLPAGRRIVYTEGRSAPRRDFLSETDGDFKDLPLAVLIDEGSASASEIVAGAVQDNDRGLIVGRRSFGKGLVQEHVSLPDSSAVRITTARYHTPSGRCIQRPYGEGVDYEEDLQGRMAHGELLARDSVRLDSTQRFTTMGGRVVFGGGGIMPDVFVGADTLERSAYLSELFFSGALNRYAFDLADRDRVRLKAMGVETFVDRYSVDASMVQGLVAEAERGGVPPDPAGLKRSERVIGARLKAAIARNIWGDPGYFRLLLMDDPEYRTARESLGSPRSSAWLRP